MKKARLWFILSIGAVIVTLMTLAFRSASGMAYFDLAMGTPKYFVVTGAPSDGPSDLPAAVRALQARGVEVVGTGCIATPEQEAYNAVVAHHFQE